MVLSSSVVELKGKNRKIPELVAQIIDRSYIDYSSDHRIVVIVQVSIITV